MAETCNNISDVKKFAKITPCGTPKFIFVADATGNKIVIEHYSGFNYSIQKPHNNLIIHTNHILEKNYIKYDKQKRRVESEKRYSIIKNKCDGSSPSNLLDIKTILDSKGVFSHQAGAKNNPNTIYQLLMDLKHEQIYFFTKYKIYQLHELVKN